MTILDLCFFVIIINKRQLINKFCFYIYKKITRVEAFKKFLEKNLADGPIIGDFY